MNYQDYYTNQNSYQDLDISKAKESLKEAIRCKTISYVDPSMFCDQEFKKLHDVIEKHFPHLVRKAQITKIDKSLLFYLEGTDKDLKPILLMAHQDVVPAEQTGWAFEPFSAFEDEKYIWGRGSLDIKCLMFAELNAIEYLLSHNISLKRSIYLSYGHDEEVGGFNGTLKLSQYLQEQNVELELVVDEGFGFITNGAKYRCPNIMIGEIGLFEKGYLDVELSCKGYGGHSSNPYDRTSLELLSNLISDICRHPFKANLAEVVVMALDLLKNDVEVEPLKTYVQDINKYRDEICQYFINDQALNIYAKTTIAPTMISGSSEASNVMPKDMKATINFRLNQTEKIKDVLDKCQSFVESDRIKIKPTRMIEASKQSRTDTLGYQKVVEALNYFYKDVRFVPSITTCGTDARHYENLCDTVLRIYPFLNESYDGIHGTNEKMEIKAYIQGIKVFIKLIEDICKGE